MNYFTIVETKEQKKLSPFRIEVEFTHGDADGESDNSFDLETEEEALGMFCLLDVFGDVDKWDGKDDVKKLAAEFGVDFEALWDSYTDLIERDETCDFYRARLDNIAVFKTINGVERELQLLHPLTPEQKKEFAAKYFKGE